MVKKVAKLKDLLKNSSSYQTRQFGKTGMIDERIQVATWLRYYK